MKKNIPSASIDGNFWRMDAWSMINVKTKKNTYILFAQLFHLFITFISSFFLPKIKVSLFT